LVVIQLAQLFGPFRHPIEPQGFSDRYIFTEETLRTEAATVRIGPEQLGTLLAAAILVSAAAPVTRAEVGTAKQPDPLGYPMSVGDEADERASESVWPPPKRADEPQVPGGLDPYRYPDHAESPAGLLAWHAEPIPASCCDRNLVDEAWMGPGGLASRLSTNRCWCSRDHTRVFRTELPGRAWLTAEYLLWATQGTSLPPLVTASPYGTPVADAGVIGTPGTRILYGNGGVDGTMRSGARLAAGYWFTPRQERGIEASWIGLANTSEQATIEAAGGAPWLAIPFVNATSGLPAAVVVAAPGMPPADPLQLAQATELNLTTQFGSVDVIYRHAIACEKFHRRYLVGGYRYLMLEDRLTNTATSLLTVGGNPIDGYTTSDSFRTLSQFNGGEFGLIERWWRDRWSLQLLGKVALGGSSVGTTIAGSTTTTQTIGADTVVTGSYPGGVLAQPTNIGRFDDSLFAAMGEFGITADYALWSQCRFLVGYTFLYWTTVGRAADQIDTMVNPSQFGGGTLTDPAAPAFNLWTTSFWAQGLSLGLEYQF
jgi:hypothetical protein